MAVTKRDTAVGTFSLLGGLGVGAAVLYFFDPQSGAQRRTQCLNGIEKFFRDAWTGLGGALRDLDHRAHAFGDSVRGMLPSAPEKNDDVLIARVRSNLGRVVAHPRAIRVTADKGLVTVSGPVLASEAPALLACVQGTRGVQSVVNRLETHMSSAGISSLQGDGWTAPSSWTEQQWSPSARLLCGVAGASLIGFGLTRRAPVACALGTIGLGLLARSSTSMSFADAADKTKEAALAAKDATVNAAVSAKDAVVDAGERVVDRFRGMTPAQGTYAK